MIVGDSTADQAPRSIAHAFASPPIRKVTREQTAVKLLLHRPAAY